MKVYIRNISSLKLIPGKQEPERVTCRSGERKPTYPKNSRVVWNLGRLWRLVLFRRLFNPQILHIATSEDNVFIDTFRRRDFIQVIATATFCTVGDDFLERDGRLFRVDLMKSTNIAARMYQLADDIFKG